MKKATSPSPAPLARLAAALPECSLSEAKLLFLFVLRPELLGDTPVAIQHLAKEAGLTWRTVQRALLALTGKRKWLVRTKLGAEGTCYRWATDRERAAQRRKAQARKAPALAKKKLAPARPKRKR